MFDLPPGLSVLPASCIAAGVAVGFSWSKSASQVMIAILAACAVGILAMVISAGISSVVTSESAGVVDLIQSFYKGLCGALWLWPIAFAHGVISSISCAVVLFFRRACDRLRKDYLPAYQDGPGSSCMRFGDIFFLVFTLSLIVAFQAYVFAKKNAF